LKRHFKIAISCFFYALWWPIFVLVNLLHLEVRARMVILYYHDIPDGARAGFARQMDMLTRRATVVGADWRGEGTQRLLCAITFDDAFNSVLTTALPELEKRQLPCTIFVPTGIMGRTPDWVMETDCKATEMVASPDLIKSLPCSLVTIGAHTVSHPFLSRIPRNAARNEIELSRSVLSEVTGQSVRLMSFPYGDYDQEVAAMCKEAGYDLVFGIEPRPVDPLADEFIRGRVAVDPSDGPLEFFLKMSGAYRWMPFASGLKQALMRR
jgi:peptidoglycan/xylan/chitin deacetylase (PgdA/CDA1 family)